MLKHCLSFAFIPAIYENNIDVEKVCERLVANNQWNQRKVYLQRTDLKISIDKQVKRANLNVSELKSAEKLNWYICCWTSWICLEKKKSFLTNHIWSFL